MLIPSHLDGVADTVAALYASLEESILRDIVRRIVKTGGVSLTAQGQIHMAQKSGKVYDEVIADVARLMEATTQQVRTLFEDACIEAMAYDFSVYEAAGLSPLPLRLSPSAAQILGAGMRKTQGLLQNLTKTTALSAQRAYISACTLAEMQVESGAFDAVTAIRNAVREASKDGAFVQYPSGHRSRVDVAIRRAVITGVNQTAGELSLHYADEMGCELVEVTAHGGARPEHAAWQGKVYSRSGKHPKYPPFKTSTGYGTGAGLCGWNCRHSFYPFFEGLSDRAYPRDKLREYEARTLEYNGKSIAYYDATQMQRAMERKIRDTRRTLAGYGEAMKAGGGRLRAAMQADFSQASVTLKKQEARLKDFLRQTGLRGDAARVQVNGFGRSISQRAVWANKRMPTYESRQKFSSEVYIIPPHKGDAITHRSLYNDLMKSETGKKALNAILSGKYDIEVNYTDECRPDILGTNIGNHIYIYAQNTKTIKRTAETLIHEMTHATEKIGGNQWAEARCIAAEWMHRKGSLTTTNLRAIIRLVKELYPLLDWRKV